MDDLISREAAKFQACNWSVKPNAVIYDGIKEAIKSQLDMAPAVDAAPVVRCRDCKYSDVIYDTTSDTMPLKCLNIRYGGVQPDWYCEHGERRDSE